MEWAPGLFFSPVNNIDIGEVSDNIDYALLTFGYLPIPSAAAYGRFNFDVVEYELKVGGLPEMEFKNAGIKGEKTLLLGVISDTNWLIIADLNLKEEHQLETYSNTQREA